MFQKMNCRFPLYVTRVKKNCVVIEFAVSINNYKAVLLDKITKRERELIKSDKFFEIKSKQ